MRISRINPDLTVRESRIAYIDTETTSTAPAFTAHGRRVWEFAAHIVDPDPVAPAVEHTIVIHDADLTFADQKSLEIGGFYRRQPSTGWASLPHALSERAAAPVIHRMLTGVSIAALNVGFDEQGLSAMFYRWGLEPEPWDYHLIELGSIAAHALGAQPPWSGTALCASLGIDAGDFQSAHSALADARMHRALHAAATRRSTRAPLWRRAMLRTRAAAA